MNGKATAANRVGSWVDEEMKRGGGEGVGWRRGRVEKGGGMHAT